MFCLNPMLIIIIFLLFLITLQLALFREFQVWSTEEKKATFGISKLYQIFYIIPDIRLGTLVFASACAVDSVLSDLCLHNRQPSLKKT